MNDLCFPLTVCNPRMSTCTHLCVTGHMPPEEEVKGPQLGPSVSGQLSALCVGRLSAAATLLAQSR